MSKNKSVVRRRVPFVYGTKNRPVPDKRKIGFAVDSSKGAMYTFIYFNGEARIIGFHWQVSHESIYNLFAGYGECFSSFTQEEEQTLKEQYSVAKKKLERYFKTHPEKA